MSSGAKPQVATLPEGEYGDENALVFDYVRRRLRSSELTGRVILHVRRGIVEQTEVHDFVHTSLLTGSEQPI